MDEPTARDWTGRWERIGERRCREGWPTLLVFRSEGIFEAPGGMEEGSWLHSGEFRVEQGDSGATLVIQAANDSMLPFRILDSGDDGFEVENDQGCSVRYRRATRQPAG